MDLFDAKAVQISWSQALLEMLIPVFSIEPSLAKERGFCSGQVLSKMAAGQRQPQY
jgi:hypothetical protein